MVRLVNEHDTTILPEALTNFISFRDRIGMELERSALTLDAGFDSKVNHKIIKEQGLIPVIYPNKRNTKELIAIARKFRWFRKDIDKKQLMTYLKLEQAVERYYIVFDHRKTPTSLTETEEDITIRSYVIPVVRERPSSISSIP